MFGENLILCTCSGTGSAGSGSEFSWCDYCRHGWCAGVVCFNTGIVVASSAVATCGPKPHGVAPAETRGDACGSHGSVSEPIPSRISPSLRTDDVSGPPSGMAPMDQYLPHDASLLLGESTDFPFLPAPLTPRQIIEKLVPGSVEGSPTGEPVAAASLSMPDLSREGPFDVHQDSSRSGASPRVLDSLRGCQYRMTSYDEDTSSSEFNPGIRHSPARSAAARVCGTREDIVGCAAAPTWHGPDLVEPSGASTVCHLHQLDVLGGHAGGVWSGAVSVGSGADCGAGSPCSTGSALYGGHGIVASTQYAGDSWPPAVVVVQRVHVLCRLLSGSPTVAAYDSGVSAERKLWMWWTLYYMDILPLLWICDIGTF